MKSSLVVLGVLFVSFMFLPGMGWAQSKDEGIRLHNEACVLLEKARTKEDMEKVVQKSEQALRIFERVGSLQGAGLVLYNLGFVYRAWSQYPKAIECFEKSFSLSSKAGDAKTAAGALNNLGLVYLETSQYPKAVECFEKALVIERKIGHVQGEAQTLNNLGNVHQYWGQYPKSVEYYEKSLGISRKIRDAKTEGQTLNNLANVYAHWGQYPKAFEYYDTSLDLSRKAGDYIGESNTLANMAIDDASLQKYKEAAEHLEQALEIKRRIGDRKGESGTLTSLGSVYVLWGQYAKGVEYYEKSLDISRKVGDTGIEGFTLTKLGSMYKDWGQYSRAVECYEKSLEISRKIGDTNTQGMTLISLGQVYRAWGEYDKALARFQEGLKVYEKMGVPTNWPRMVIGNLYLDKGDLERAEPFIRQSESSDSLGRLALLSSDYPKAKAHYEELRHTAEKNRDAASFFTAHTGLGMACEGLGDTPAAAEHFRKAIDYTEDLRAGLKPAERAEFYNVIFGGFYRTAPYEGLARVLVKLNKPADALRESEYTKARVFAEGLSRRAEGSAPQVPKNVLEADSQLNDHLAALTNNLQKAYEKENKETITVLEPQVKEAKGRLAAHVEMLRKDYPLFAATKYPQPMTLAQSDLKEDEWVLAFHVTDPGIIIYLTRGRNLAKGLFKPIPRKDVDELVRKFRRPMELGPDDSVPQKLSKFDFAAGKQLSDLILGAILSDLPKDAPVIIIPDGSLGVVPFEMLVLNDGGKVTTDNKGTQTSGAEFFGDRNPISYYQSITALTLARTLGKQQKPGEKLLAMVDPVFSSDDPRLTKLAKQEKDRLLATLPRDLTMSIQTESGITFPRLVLTAQLGDSLKKADPSRTDLYDGMTAKKSVLLGKDLTQYRSLLFATHGYFGKDLPGIQEPVLVLSLVGEPKGQDGFLRLSEVMGLKINCDIAALTACQTGLGRQISGEGTMGMGRAFQYAGAKSVLMSLWSVSETASVNLVESFFKHLKEGKNKLESLKLARGEIRNAGYDHPFYWAPFILVGEVD
jgi:tetratricopeptide (TPR) repeat protein